jgi:hypothetical protein
VKILFASILILFIGYTDVSEQDISNLFNSSDLVITAKVIDIRAVTGIKVICNLEIEKIYKGKRLKTVLLQLDEENEMELYKIYILYLEKSKDKNSSFFFNKRRVIESSEFYKNEIDYLNKLVDGKKFKNVKNPVPKHEIHFDCGCK